MCLLFFDFLKDPASKDIEDLFMFGPDLLVVPVIYEGAISRVVYLPSGADCVETWSGHEFHGGQYYQADPPLERIPVYWRKGSLFTFQF
jgi:alpha-glucosidase (family GH31 glycosyl hydrolase)